MYIRFVITQTDEDSRQSQGLFRAAGSLLDSGDIDTNDRVKLQSVLDWFNQNLPVPDKPCIGGRVIFWFKTGAQECIQQMWILVNILRANSYLVEVQKCGFLYNIAYQDDFQVAAFPHRQDGKRTFK